MEDIKKFDVAQEDTRIEGDGARKERPKQEQEVDLKLVVFCNFYSFLFCINSRIFLYRVGFYFE